MKYIDVDKLIAEIERRRDSALERQKNLEKIGQETVLNEMIAFELNKILSFITHLYYEQLEVDFEKEIALICETYGITKYLDAELGPHDIKNIAHHFYELGLNARKEK